LFAGRGVEYGCSGLLITVLLAIHEFDPIHQSRSGDFINDVS
jgi:hypothetical protein